MEKRILTPVEARVLGCLIEKEATTPDAYPLTLNALTTACNQKSNRDPVMDLGEDEVMEAVASLQRDTLIAQRSSAGSRVLRYFHRLNSRLEDEFDFSQKERAVMCVLMLRGAQTSGEIRTRCARIFEFQDLGELEATLGHLARREDGPYLLKLPRQPGQKESRYVHLLCGEPDTDSPSPQPSPSPSFSAAPAAGAGTGADQTSIAALESKVAALQDALDTLTARFEKFVQQFE